MNRYMQNTRPGRLTMPSQFARKGDVSSLQQPNEQLHSTPRSLVIVDAQRKGPSRGGKGKSSGGGKGPSSPPPTSRQESAASASSSSQTTYQTEQPETEDDLPEDSPLLEEEEEDTEDEDELETEVEEEDEEGSSMQFSNTRLFPGENPLGYVTVVEPDDPPCIQYLVQCIQSGNDRRMLKASEVLRLYEQDIRTPEMAEAVKIGRFVRALAVAVDPLPRSEKAAFHTLYLRAAETLLTIKLKPKFQFLVSLPLIASSALNLPWNLDDILQNRTEAAVLKWNWLHSTVAVNILFHYGKLAQPMPHDLLSVIMASIEHYVRRDDKRLNVGVMLKVLTSLCRISAVPEATQALVMFEGYLEVAFRSEKLMMNAEPRITMAYRVTNRPEPAWLLEFRKIRKALFRSVAGTNGQTVAVPSSATQAVSASAAASTAASTALPAGMTADGEWMSDLAESLKAFEEEEAAFGAMMEELKGQRVSSSAAASGAAGRPERAPGHDDMAQSTRRAAENAASRSLEEARYRAEAWNALKSAKTASQLIAEHRRLRKEHESRPTDTGSKRTYLQTLGHFIQRAGEFAWSLRADNGNKSYRPLPLVSTEYSAAVIAGSQPSARRGNVNSNAVSQQSGVTATVHISNINGNQRTQNSPTPSSSSKSSAKEGTASNNNSSGEGRESRQSNRNVLKELQQAYMEASFELLDRDRDLMKKQMYGVKPWENAYYMGLSQEDMNALESKYSDWLSSQRVLPETAYRTLNACQRLIIRPKGSALIAIMQALSLADSRPELLDVHKKSMVLFAFSQLAMPEEFNRCCIWFLPSIVEAARASNGFARQNILRNRLERAFINMGLPRPTWLSAGTPVAPQRSNIELNNLATSRPNTPPSNNASNKPSTSAREPAAPAAPLTAEEKKAQKLARRLAQAQAQQAGQKKNVELPPFAFPVPEELLFVDEPLSSNGENSELIFKAIADDPDRFTEHTDPKKLVRFLYTLSKRSKMIPTPKEIGFGVMKGPFTGAVLHNTLMYLTYFEGWRPVLRRLLWSGKLDAEDVTILWKSLKESRYRPDREIIQWLERATKSTARQMTDDDLAYTVWSIANCGIRLQDAGFLIDVVLSKNNRLTAAHACRIFYALAIYVESVHHGERSNQWPLEMRDDTVEMFEGLAKRIGALPDWDFALDERTNGQVVSGVRLLRTSGNQRLRNVPDLIPSARLDLFIERFKALVAAGRDPQRVSKLQESGAGSLRNMLEIYTQYFMTQVDAMFKANFGDLIQSRDDLPIEFKIDEVYTERVTDDGLHSIDLTMERFSGERAAYEIDGPLHHVFSLDINNPGRLVIGLTGKTHARQRLLVAAGWDPTMLTGDDVYNFDRSLKAELERIKRNPELESQLLERASVQIDLENIKRLSKARDGDIGATVDIIIEEINKSLTQLEAEEKRDVIEGEESLKKLLPGIHSSLKEIRRYVMHYRAISETIFEGERLPALVLGELDVGRDVLPSEIRTKIWLAATDLHLQYKNKGVDLNNHEIQYTYTDQLTGEKKKGTAREAFNAGWKGLLVRVREWKLKGYQDRVKRESQARQANVMGYYLE